MDTHVSTASSHRSVASLASAGPALASAGPARASVGPARASAGPARRSLTDAEIEADQRATELISALVALPADHPGRPALRRQAIEAWLPMAYRLMRRYAGRGELADDLRQTACVGLIKAIDGFDPSRGDGFVGYAIPTVLGELRRHFRDRTWTMRIPRRLQELRLAIGRARTELGQTLDRAPTVADIAGHLGVGEEAVLEALESGHAYRPTSLSALVSAESGLELGDTLGAEDRGFAMVEFGVSLSPAMAALSDRERHIIALRFSGNLTQTQIAEKIGISQMHVSRLLSRALRTLRSRLDGDVAAPNG